MDSTTTEDIDIDDFDENFINDEEEAEEEEAPLPPNPYLDYEAFYPPNTNAGPAGSVVEHPLRDREVVGSIPGRAIPKALKMVPVATLLGAQHYKASTGFSSPNKVSHN